MKHSTKWIKTTAGAALLGLSAGTALAEICSLDNVPAATLLIPHFQVPLDQCSQGGPTTLISVRNASADAVVARVNIWSNADRPVTGFPIYLDAFDSVDINMADLLCSGAVPVTDPDFSGEPPSNLGNPPVQRPMCPGPGSGQAYEQITITPAFLQTIQAYLTGNPSPQTGLTKGINFGDNVARGFVTIDTVDFCSTLLPGDPGYFIDQISDENVLVGEYRLIDPNNNFSQGQRAVAIESAAGAFAPGETTFYGRYEGLNAVDQREPLPATFFTHAGFDGSAVDTPETSLIAWREGSGSRAEFFPGTFPPEFPLGTTGNGEPLFYFDAANEPVLPPTPLPGEPTPVPQPIRWSSQWLFGFELEQVGYGSASPNDNMLYMNLLSLADNQLDTGQAWVTPIESSQGIFSGMGGAFALDNGCTAGKQITISSSGALGENPRDPGVIFSDRFQN